MVWDVFQDRGSTSYTDQEQFFRNTYQTETLTDLFESVEKRLQGQGGTPLIRIQNPLGGGKTHALVALYYAAKHAADSRIAPHLKDLPHPVNVSVAAISGEECGDQGIIHRGGQTIKTLWGDICWQLGSY